MNTPLETPVFPASVSPAIKFEDYVRQHPGVALLVAGGLGLAAVLVARALTPEPPRNRAVRLLEDIQCRLAGLVEDGAHAMGKGAESLGHLNLDRKLEKLSRWFKSLGH